MAKVFTITPGLENMGAMKTGGQGSVYKARRVGEIITAVKILPTPIYSESADDKNYVAFQNEVDKLKKVNEQPNPNVVKILNSGITESGNLPFIEMEFIEGPDLEELLKAPHDPVFTVKEVLKVAEQLSNALAHCHKLDVKHGDIKSNNVKFSNSTANYVLLDFGLAIMLDEERRSSMKQAGAIEFMAPEQNTGQMLLQTDVYSFGVVLFELLTGTVPFELKDRSESARNEVRLAHMVTPVPDLLKLRWEGLPENWNEHKKQSEMKVPEWLVKMIYKCLEKKPAARFANGVELHDFIIENFISSGNLKVSAEGLLIQEKQNKDLLENQKKLQEQLNSYRQEVLNRDREIEVLKMQLDNTNKKLQLLKDESVIAQPKKGVSKASFTLLLCLTVALAAFAIFSVVKSSPSTNNQRIGQLKQSVDSSDSEVPAPTVSQKSKKARDVSMHKTEGELATENKVIIEEKAKASKTPEKRSEDKSEQTEAPVAKAPDPAIARSEKKTEERQTERKFPAGKERTDENLSVSEGSTSGVLKKYKVVSKAYFYNEPNESSREDMFIGPWENAVVDAINERYGFVLVEIRNPEGQVFRGWLRKKDLKLHSIQ